MSIFAVVTFVAFVLFSFAGVIDWSPVWVSSPLWIYLVLLVCTIAEQALTRGVKENKK